MTQRLNSQFLIYQTEGGQTRLEVRLEGETVWLSQKMMAELFQKDVRTISEHIQNIFDEHELLAEATIRKFRIVQTEGKREVSREVDFYNLDMIISVGYRVKSHTATRFRQWAITGNTAAEIIYQRSDSQKPNMGLTNWRGSKLRKQDVTIAKNYLDEDELRALNNLVEQYLVFAEGQAMRRIPMHMLDWLQKLDGFLQLNDRNILDHAGKISHEMAAQHANEQYAKFHQQRLQMEAQQANEQDFDSLATQVEKQHKKQDK